MLGKIAAYLSVVMVCASTVFGADHSPRLKCKVLRVIDGDTVECLLKISELYDVYKREMVRLAHIDTPELKGENQAAGLAAKKMLSDLIDLEIIEMEWVDFDKYGRTLGRLFLDDGAYVNELLLKQGYAVVPAYDRSVEANRLRKLYPPKPSP